MRKYFVVIALSTLLASATGRAGATTAEAKFTILEGSDTTIFELPQSPVPDFHGSNGFGFFVTPATFDGSATVLQDLFFNNAADGGGLFAFDFFSFQGQVPQLYSGVEQSPNFLAGIYPNLLDNLDGNFAVLTVSIPEPSSWILKLLGFVGLGLAGYRRAAHMEYSPTLPVGTQPSSA